MINEKNLDIIQYKENCNKDNVTNGEDRIEMDKEYN